jgi:hypothetical protein
MCASEGFTGPPSGRAGFAEQVAASAVLAFFEDFVVDFRHVVPMVQEPRA